MQSVSSRIWTRVAVSITYDDNDYTLNDEKTIICLPIIIKCRLVSFWFWLKLYKKRICFKKKKLTEAKQNR